MFKQMFLIFFVLICGVFSTQAQTAAEKKQILNRIIQIGELTQAKVKERGGVNNVLDIQSVDLNKDSKPEFIVSCDCSLGQMTFVFRKTASGVEDIFVGDLRSAITPLNSYTKGWRNLRYEIAGSASGGVYSETLKFNGRKYK